MPDFVTSIGAYAFRNCNNLTSVVLGDNLQTIGEHAFYGCKSLTAYAEATELPSGWNSRWNSSYRPAIWGCKLSADKSYVESFTFYASALTNANSKGGLSVPERDGYTFGGWTTVKGGTTVEYQNDGLFDDDGVTKVPEGAELYAIWIQA